MSGDMRSYSPRGPETVTPKWSIPEGTAVVGGRLTCVDGESVVLKRSRPSGDSWVDAPSFLTANSSVGAPEEVEEYYAHLAAIRGPRQNKKKISEPRNLRLH